MVFIKDIINKLEQFAPLSLQESYDNCGLIVGDANREANGVLLSVDCTEAVVAEAIRKGANMIISHHPIVFQGLKKFTGHTYIERTVIAAIKNDIAIYAAHTNFDNVAAGVNARICSKIGLSACKVLEPMKQQLHKLVVFVPVEYAEKIRIAIFSAGGGVIGNYDCCSYNLSGVGTFRATELAKPFVGEKNRLHHEPEERIEVVMPKYISSRVVRAMLEVHPYEEVAYDLYPLDNNFEKIGAGMYGELPVAVNEIDFLMRLKEVFNSKQIRHTALRGKKIKTVAVCGGSGSSLLNKAIGVGADIFVNADFKYHQFFDADNKIIIADLGHFETEQFTNEIFYDIVMKNFSNFAVSKSEVSTNPVNYI